MTRRKTTVPSPAARIGREMGESLRQDGAVSPELHATLMDLILAEQIDEALSVALPLLERPRQRQLVSYLRDMASVLEIERTTPETGPIRLESQVFVVPVYGLAQHLIHMDQNPVVLEGLTQAISSAGFVSDDVTSSVIFHPSLIDPVEAMQTTPGALFEIIKGMLHAESEKDGVETGPGLGTTPAASWMHGPLDVRLLVGLRTLITPQDADSVPDFFTTFPDDGYDEAADRWIEGVEAVMQQAGLGLRCGIPLGWNEALYQIAIMQMQVQKTDVIQAKGQDPFAPHDEIHFCVMDTRILVRIQHRGDWLGTMVLARDAVGAFLPSLLPHFETQSEIVVEHDHPDTFPGGTGTSFLH